MNLKKFIYLLGSTNIAEVLIFILGTFLGLPAPATAIMVLYINLITDSIVALALGLEAPEEGVMQEAPADPTEPLIGRAMWIRIMLHTLWSTVLFLGYYVSMLVYYTGQFQGVAVLPPMGNTTASNAVYDVAKQANADGITGARTALIILIVTSEMLRGYTAKNFDTNDWRFDNTLLNISVFSGIGLTIAIAIIPGIKDFFALGGTIDWVGWVTSLALSITVFPVDAILKYVFPRTKSFHHHHVVKADEVPNAERYGLVSVKPRVTVHVEPPQDVDHVSVDVELVAKEEKEEKDMF